MVSHLNFAFKDLTKTELYGSMPIGAWIKAVCKTWMTNISDRILPLDRLSDT